MKEKIKIKAVDMVRRIRDEHAQMLTGKSESEIIAFFKNAGEAARQRAKSRQSTQSLSQQKGYRDRE
ncbi:MAG: hypothetical protein JRH18_09200 [Deltaproteobacteria bacterium]|nr:hypothetical protein [Deltaproteobacteria bacterium]MBW2151829.1 hypothetical protein [Deltaproteobacteria bacterium]